MRILHVVPTYYPSVRYGGPIRSVHGLARALVARGHEVHVCTTTVDGPGDLDVSTTSAVDLDGVSVHYFPVPTLRRLYFSPRMADFFRNELGRFDLVHLHSVYLWPTWAAARQARHRRIPYVISPRGLLIRDLIQRKSRWLKRAWIALIEKRNLAGAAAIHVTAPLEAEELHAMKLPVPATFCVGNGVEWPARHSTLQEGPYAGVTHPYALFLSRINWKKGLDRLLKAWQMIPDLKLIIAGNDDEGYQSTLQALALTLGIEDRVEFIGAVSDEHKWALYENAQLFVLPSYSENFGNVVAEAMAMGCPVVITPEVGIAPIVRAAGAGVICDGEPDLLAQTILHLSADAASRAKMGAAGRACAEASLSWNGIAAEMEAEYGRCLSSLKESR